ncbi:MAG: glycosyl hydrolase family 65 protein [Victivallales bacterium]
MTDSALVETEFDPASALAREGLYTQGSGYLHVRGSLEEHVGDSPQNQRYLRMPGNVTAEKFMGGYAKWGTYVPGIFGNHPLLNREMINLPWFIGMAPTINGERLDMARSRIRSYRRELDVDTAVLRRSLVWLPSGAPPATVRFERFVSAARPNLCIQRMILRSEGDITVTVESGIDADVLTSGHDHFTSASVEPFGAHGLRCQVCTDSNDHVQIASCITPLDAPWQFSGENRRGTLRVSFTLAAGQELSVEKRTAVTTGRDRNPIDAISLLRAAEGMTFDLLCAEHAAVWRKRWEKSDVVVEGDDRDAENLRISIYHLLRCHVPDDDRVSIDAKGYAGDAYFGRFFWDTEMYMLPFYIYTDPERARTLVDFRVQTLPGACENAKAYGYSGARYGWESDDRGTECCPNWQYRDHEIHITADVAYGFLHYARGTGDETYLKGPAAKVLVETARYWLDRIDYREGDGYPSLLGVMGPNEYTPISHNNAYTNRVVRLSLEMAAQYGQSGGATPEECERFRSVGTSLPVPRAKDGVLVLQCDDFDRLADPQFDRIWRDRSKGYYSSAGQEHVYRSKALKQADVLMLMMLFPQEFSDTEVRRAWDYYLPLTTHDSSLSAGVHAIIAARLGLKKEMCEFWKKTSGLDVDFAHGGAGNGIHIANAAATWMVAVFGFAGLSSAMHADHMELKPQLPDTWSRLAFPLTWKGCQVSIDIRRDKVVVRNTGTKPITVTVKDHAAPLPAGGEHVFPNA